MNVDFQNIRTAKELVFEMRRIWDAIRLIHDGCSVTVNLRGCEGGQERKIELSLDPAEIGEAVELALRRHIDALRALREESEDIRKGYLALINEEALKIDPDTAEMIWTNGDALDPYALGPVSPLQPDTLCFVYSPGKTNCVWIGDLPIETREALRLKRGKQSGSSASAAWQSARLGSQNAVAPEIGNRADVGRECRDPCDGPAWMRG